MRRFGAAAAGVSDERAEIRPILEPNRKSLAELDEEHRVRQSFAPHKERLWGEDVISCEIPGLPWQQRAHHFRRREYLPAHLLAKVRLSALVTGVV